MTTDAKPSAALLFDLDGTLVESELLHLSAFNAILAPFGRVLGDRDFSQHVSGQANGAIMSFLFPDKDAETRRRLAEEKEIAFRALVAEGVLEVPGAVELVQWARRRNLATGLVTNAPRANAELLVDAIGLAGMFDIVVIGEEQGRGKPDPGPYLAALDGLNIGGPSTVAIEDSLAGIAAARGAGIDVVAVATTLPYTTLHATGAALIVEDMKSAYLLNFLDERFKAVCS